MYGYIFIYKHYIKLEFHIVLTCHESSFFYLLIFTFVFSTVEKWKTVLNSQAYKNRWRPRAIVCQLLF